MQPPAIQLQTKITQKVKYLLQDAVDKAENRFFVPPLLYGLFLTQTCITQKSCLHIKIQKITVPDKINIVFWFLFSPPEDNNS